MSELKKYVDLKRRVEQAQQKADKAEGALEQVMEQLKEKFGCSTLKDAKKKLTLLKEQEQELKIKFEDALEEFEENWGGDEE